MLETAKKNKASIIITSLEDKVAEVLGSNEKLKDTTKGRLLLV